MNALSAPTWDEAFLRIESYLRAYGLESRVRLNQITSEIIQSAQALWYGGNDTPPVMLAMQVARERVDAWFTSLGLAPELTNERSTADARVALILADFPGRWSDHFLNGGVLPEPFVRALGSTPVLPTPELKIANMPPAPLELPGGAPAAANSAPPHGKLPQSALLWLCLLCLFSAAWAASH